MDCIRYAVYAAEQVIDIFEKKYPKNKRPRESIQAAKRYLKNPSKENKEKCKVAAESAWSAILARAKARTTDTLMRVTAAAVVAIDASKAVAYDATWAAENASGAAAAAGNDKRLEKIIKYGLKLLKEIK
jgi:hypothetical protein